MSAISYPISLFISSLHLAEYSISAKAFAGDCRCSHSGRESWPHRLEMSSSGLLALHQWWPEGFRVIQGFELVLLWLLSRGWNRMGRCSRTTDSEGVHNGIDGAEIPF